MTINNQKTDKELLITLRISRETLEEYIQESLRKRQGFKFKDDEQWWHTMEILYEAMEDYWARNFETGALENLLERVEAESEPSDEET
jgi:hypothetical protein